MAVSQIVDDSSPLVPTRKPSHGDIESITCRFKLDIGDPNLNGQSFGKTKRINAVLNWALDNDQEAGEYFISALLSMIKGHGGFREESPNYVGIESIMNLQSSFKTEGIFFSNDGIATPVVLDNLSELDMEEALQGYIRRAKKGASDAALLTGTSKDLLEAVAAHVISRLLGNYKQDNFPALLGFAFHVLGLSTPESEGSSTITRRLEISFYELGCAINNLRNKQGTGHGRPFLPNVSDVEAKAAIESMGMISEFLLSKLNERL